MQRKLSSAGSWQTREWQSPIGAVATIIELYPEKHVLWNSVVNLLSCRLGVHSALTVPS